MQNKIIKAVTEAAFEEIQKPAPEAIDCSDSLDRSNVLIFNGIDLRPIAACVIRKYVALR